MAKPFFYLRKKDSKKPEIIYLGLRHFSNDKNHIAISTGIKVLPSHWNERRKEVKQVAFPEVDLPSKFLNEKSSEIDMVSYVNNKLYDIQFYVETKKECEVDVLKREVDNYLNGRNEAEEFAFDLNQYLLRSISNGKRDKKALSKEMVIDLVNTYLTKPENEESFFEYVKKFIKESETGERLNSGKRISPLTIKKYQSTLLLIEEFQKNYERQIAFSNIDKEFIDDFNSYMAEVMNYAPATMGKHVSILKTFLKEATEDGVNSNLAFKSKAFKVIETVSDSIALTPLELDDIFSLNLYDNKKLERVRDLFILASNTGLRFSDFTELTSDNIIKSGDGYNIERIQHKGKRKVIIPINNRVLEILEKYSYKLPEAISNQKFNEYLKNVCSKANSLQVPYLKSITKGGITSEVRHKRWELVSSHTGRRSFATNAYERGVPTLSIMAITGHKTEKAFLSYIKTSSTKHAEIFRKHS